MQKLRIAEELRLVLQPEDVERTITIRNTTDVRCVVCGEEIPAGSPETANVLVSENAIGAPLVQFAHERCHRSGFTGRRLDSFGGGGVVALCWVREHPTSPAVLVWEPYRQLRIDGEDVHTRLCRWLGLRPSRSGVLSTGGPWLQTLTVRLTPTRAWVALTAHAAKVMRRRVPEQARLKVDEQMDWIALAPAPSIIEWRRAAERSGRCLLVTGTGLGLEHPRLEREDLLLEQGDALAGVAPVRVIADSDGGR